MAKNNKTEAPLSAAGFGLRLLAALALVLLTYNPSGFSAYHWVTGAISASAFGPLHLLMIGVLLAGWAVFWVATWRSLDAMGVALLVIIAGTGGLPGLLAQLIFAIAVVLVAVRWGRDCRPNWLQVLLFVGLGFGLGALLKLWLS